ncbi:MAG: reverse transcriptase/maturase family protein [Patescibacteria group bacterium]
MISLGSLLDGWHEFKCGKQKKTDVQEFSFTLEDSLFRLHEDLKNETYQHGKYSEFYVHDPKLRHIHKACVRDRIVHHVVMRAIEPFFEKSFIFDSYSSRTDKGTHRAVKRFRKFAWKLSQNNTKTVWILKCDIRRFFDSVDHAILKQLIRKRIHCDKTLRLIDEIIESFFTNQDRGIPLGNLTSQLFSNIYLNLLDQFAKRTLRTKFYIRYADDFVLLSRDREELEYMLGYIHDFVRESLKMELHPKKVIFQKWHQGVDFLGYISFPRHAILRTKTKRRMLRKMQQRKNLLQEKRITPDSYNQSLQSYLGILKHASSRNLKIQMRLFSENFNSKASSSIPSPTPPPVDQKHQFHRARPEKQRSPEKA